MSYASENAYNMDFWNPKYKQPHESHEFGEPYYEMRMPAHAFRHYEIFKCKKCGLEKMTSVSGRFWHEELEFPCEDDL